MILVQTSFIKSFIKPVVSSHFSLIQSGHLNEPSNDRFSLDKHKVSSFEGSRVKTVVLI